MNRYSFTQSKSRKIVSICILIFLCSSCAYHEITPTQSTSSGITQLNTIGSNPNVYVAGVVGNAAVIWRNGNADTLNYATQSGQANITSVFVDGTDVYAAGWTWNHDPNTGAIATYWKNGHAVSLSDATRDTYLEAIFVANNHVYVVGYETGIIGQKDIPTRALCWQDGNVVTLSSEGAINSTALAVYVSGTDIYAAGWTRFLNGQSRATYWKNRIPVYLTDGTSPGVAQSILVSGNDVYAAGVENFYSPQLSVDAHFIISPEAKCRATYWKNGKPVTLSSEASYATSIFVNGSDVYVAGTIANATAIGGSTPFGNVSGDLATYWKNGVQINLNDDNDDSIASSISVTANGDVYLAGSISNQAAYWVNGAQHYFPKGNNNSYLYSVFLTN